MTVNVHNPMPRQVDEEPPIRANTTILLGNLAAHLGEATQKRVLLNAFTRALKDSFPPARVAGLKVGAVMSDFRQFPLVFGVTRPALKTSAPGQPPSPLAACVAGPAAE